MKTNKFAQTFGISAALGMLFLWMPSLQAQERMPSYDNTRPQLNEAEQQRLDEKQKRQEFVRRGIDLYQQRKYAAAEAIFRQLIQAEPEEAKYHFYLGNSLFYQGKLSEAQTEYQEAIRLNGKYALAYNALGFLHASQGQWNEAIAHYQKALEINANYADALKNLGDAFWKNGNQTEAKSNWEKALALYTKQGNNKEAQRLQELLQRNQ